jgi:uncharacterized protein YndB with AHSA1/START domain
MITPDVIEVGVRIAAPPGHVFGFFTDPARYVEWMGSAARLEPVPGGRYWVTMRDGFAAAGTVAEVSPPHRVVFTWGWADDAAARHVRGDQAPADGSALRPGSSRVEVLLAADGDAGTRLTLRHHDLATAELRQAHQEAWTAYLARLVSRAAGGDPGRTRTPSDGRCPRPLVSPGAQCR